ncbi:hypothetical protein E7T06_16795 [Deinococcus sp. Arct2-2]|nr:hypothetical protein E7T06_16795 [Deinococcus sp. Arct2-2]
MIREIDPQVNLSSGALWSSLERLMGTGYQVMQFDCWSFGFRLVNSLDVRLARVGGKPTLREIELELSETTLNLYTSGSLIAWRPEHS